MSNREKIIEILIPKLEEMGCFLVDLKVNPALNKFEVFIDNDEGITIEICEKVSRFLEFTLDHDETFPKQYSLDVSSPGMDNPFRVPRQYAKSIGKMVEIVLNNGVKKEGMLMEADEEMLKIAVHFPPKKKGMRPEIQEEVIKMNDIKSTSKKITFK